jgi:hypothetical protein
MRQPIVDLFLARFTVSDEEANALSSSNVPVIRLCFSHRQ